MIIKTGVIIVIQYKIALKIQDIDNKQNREIDLQKSLPQKTSLIIGRTEIQRWMGQDFEVWRNEIERRTQNERSTEDTKNIHMRESLKKNGRVKEFVETQVMEKP